MDQLWKRKFTGVQGINREPCRLFEWMPAAGATQAAKKNETEDAKGASAATKTSPSIRLFCVDGTTGERLAFSTTLLKRTCEVKERVSEVMKIPAAQMRLSWRGRVLSDAKTLISYHIEPGECLHVTRTSSSGQTKDSRMKLPHILTSRSHDLRSKDDSVGGAGAANSSLYSDLLSPSAHVSSVEVMEAPELPLVSITEHANSPREVSIWSIGEDTLVAEGGALGQSFFEPTSSSPKATHARRNPNGQLEGSRGALMLTVCTTDDSARQGLTKFHVNVHELDKVYQVKRHIQAQMGLKVCEQRLTYSGRTMCNSKSLMHYGVQNNETLQLVRPFGKLEPLSAALEKNSLFLMKGASAIETTNIRIAVREVWPGGVLHHFCLPADGNIQDLKACIAEASKVAPERQVLLHRGRVCQDNLTADYYNLQAGDVIDLVQRGGLDPMPAAAVVGRSSSISSSATTAESRQHSLRMRPSDCYPIRQDVAPGGLAASPEGEPSALARKAMALRSLEARAAQEAATEEEEEDEEEEKESADELKSLASSSSEGEDGGSPCGSSPSAGKLTTPGRRRPSDLAVPVQVTLESAAGLESLGFTGNYVWAMLRTQSQQGRPWRKETRSVNRANGVASVFHEPLSVKWLEGDSLEVTLYDEGGVGQSTNTSTSVLLPCSEFVNTDFEGELALASSSPSHGAAKVRLKVSLVKEEARMYRRRSLDMLQQQVAEEAARRAAEEEALAAEEAAKASADAEMKEAEEQAAAEAAAAKEAAAELVWKWEVIHAKGCKVYIEQNKKSASAGSVKKQGTVLSGRLLEDGWVALHGAPGFIRLKEHGKVVVKEILPEWVVVCDQGVSIREERAADASILRSVETGTILQGRKQGVWVSLQDEAGYAPIFEGDTRFLRNKDEEDDEYLKAAWAEAQAAISETVREKRKELREDASLLVEAASVRTILRVVAPSCDFEGVYQLTETLLSTTSRLQKTKDQRKKEMPAVANGLPVWKQEDGIHWLFFGKDGCWHIGGPDCLKQGFLVSGVATTLAGAAGTLPDETLKTDWKVLTEKGKWATAKSGGEFRGISIAWEAEEVAPAVRKLVGKHTPDRHDEWKDMRQAKATDTFEAWDDSGNAKWRTGPEGSYGTLQVMGCLKGLYVCKIVVEGGPMKLLPENAAGHLVMRLKINRDGTHCWPERGQHWTLKTASEVESLEGRWVPARAAEWSWQYQAESEDTHELWDREGNCTWFKGPEGYSGTIKVLEDKDGECVCKVVTETGPSSLKTQRVRELRMIIHLDGTHSWPDLGEHYKKQDAEVAANRITKEESKRRDTARKTVVAAQNFDSFLGEVATVAGLCDDSAAPGIIDEDEEDEPDD
eukprot:TRINITY_DN11276_c1_g2_i1.p1 TRINITY_DN11276_c1_g2~~TRINITY_DN11276_c1_g2_i1.p1  ORF type:complete len:1355 (+),score=286.13 TRINITY_DN11276_c1_g2_i1:126-4190(+)